MSFMEKVKGMLGQHPDKAQQGVDRAGDMVDERTGGKHARQVDTAQDKADEFIDREKPQQP